MFGARSTFLVFWIKKISYCELYRLFLLNVLAANEVIHVMHIRSYRGNGMGGLQPISRDTDNNAAMYKRG